MKNVQAQARIDALTATLTEQNGYKVEATELYVGENFFEADGAEYLVLTEEERNEAIEDHIRETLWAFNADFLANMTDLDTTVFEALQPLCEGANAAILSIIEKTCGMSDFISEAVMHDGPGHFVASYDGEELEAWGGENGDDIYYIYRTN